MTTIREVAQAAGVSVATVSHVINETRYVSPELQEKVRAVMADLGYTPDGRARSLRLRRTQTMGLVVPDNTNPFFAGLARLVEDEGFEAGYTTILGNSDERPEREERYVEALLSKRVDGLILAATLHHPPGVEALLRRSRLPVVLIDRELDVPGVDVVLTDNRGGGRQAARHLLDLGHRHLACIAGPAGRPSAERLEGFADELTAAGVALPTATLVEGDFQYAGGRSGMAALLDAGVPFSGVFVANDLMAAGALAELHARGVDVPGDVSVVGFDDSAPAVFTSPALTTVRQPLAEMGRMAISLLERLIEGQRIEKLRVTFQPWHKRDAQPRDEAAEA